MRKIAALLCFIFLCGAGSAPAQVPGLPSGAPESLSAWRDWVLYGYEDRYHCPSAGAGPSCVWPVALSMDLDSTGGRFTLTAELFLEGGIMLPGDTGAWPVEMADANGAPVPVLRNLNSPDMPPQAWLPAGRHTLSGRFKWPKMPETITIPSGYALDLTADGERRNFPVMEASAGQTRLWLRQAEGAPPEGQSADSLSVTVNRLIVDSQPMMIASRFRLTVTGQAREVLLNNALLPDTRATLLNSPLPAQLNGTGLRVKVKPGVYEIVLESRLVNRSESVGPAPENALWGREFWAYEARPQLRLAEISGAGQIDPSQADIFEDWKRFPIYAPEPGAKLIFTDLRRGDPSAQPDQLNLSRECWLDYDGDGLSCRDHLTGILRRQWHLNTSESFSLAQAALDGQAQVITRQINSKGEEAQGLQLRKGALDLTADLRIDDFSGSLPASGWDHDLETVGQKINLPPGYGIFHVSGAEALRDDGLGAGTWAGSWSALDFFIVLVISIAVWKLYGPRLGALALVALVFCYQEQLAPRMLFLHLLGTSAVLRLLPPVGTIRDFVRLWRFAAVLLLIALSFLFLINQARLAIYPQLESPNAWYGDSFYSLVYTPSERLSLNRADMAPEPMEESLLEAEATMDLLAGESLIQASAAPSGKALANSSALKAAPPRQETAKFAQSQIVPPDARVQNSLARPAWNWRSVRLHYNGSVSADQKVDFFLVSPAMGRFLGLLRIALMTMFTLMMLTEGRFALKIQREGKGLFAAAALMLSLAALLFPAPLALAQEAAFPGREMLDEYRARLMAERNEPNGFPSVGFPLAALTLTENSLRLEMEVEAGRPTVWPLPSLDGEFFRYARVTLGDGAALPLLEDGPLYTWLPAGIHRVIVEGPLRIPAGRDSFQLSFTRTAIPLKLIADAPGFRVEGLEPDGRVRGEAINIFAANGAARADTEDAGGSQVLEPFFIVSRTISMGLEWQANTVVSRLLKSDAPVSLRLPLVPGEEPMGEEFQREGGEMTINFAPGQEYVQWVSRLEAVPELTLKAADGPFTESWALDASSLWRVKYEGLTPVHTASEGYWQPAWRPWPGEELRLSIDRPQPVPGAYRVIDKAGLSLSATENIRSHSLSFTVRGSQAGPYSFTLPCGAEVKTFTVDGQSMPLAPAGQAAADACPVLTAPLSAGARDIAVAWTDEKPIGAVLKTPALDLGLPAANISINARLPEDRWILWTKGPLNGPAVQFWPLLAVLFLFSFILARFKTPLGRLSWFLFGLGLIQLGVWEAMLAAGWLLALGHRAERGGGLSPRLYNFSQIALVLWTFISLGLIYKGIQYGLLANPDMLIEGGGSYGQELGWFTDRIPGPWPRALVYSVSAWVYKALMLAWSLWMAVNLVRWLKWGWKAFSGGGLWKKTVKAKAGEK